MSEYQTCMTGRMRELPKGIPKEERGRLFCVAAKQCSGKAKTDAEAQALCNQPKEPKERKSRKKRPEGCPPCPVCSGGSTSAPVAPEKPLTCDDRKTRVLQTMEAIIDKVKEGDAAAVVGHADIIVADIAACYPAETGMPDMAKDAQKALKDMSKDYYFKGEIKEMKNQLDLIRKML